MLSLSPSGSVAIGVLLVCAAGCGRTETPRENANSQPHAAPVASSGGEQSYANVVEKVAQSVVTIRSERRVRAPRQFPFPFSLEPFSGLRGQPGPAPDAVQLGLGSGVVVDSKGDCVTNHHVVDGAENIRVELADGHTYVAKLVGSDAPSDLAVLKIDASGLPALAPGNSDAVRVGDVALAVGNPLGVGQTVTMGIISAKGRSTGLSDGTFEDFLQTDAPINQGNSGGALVNTNAELIGINSQILSPSGGNIGIGFAIPSNMVKTVMDQLIRNGRVRRGQLGVTVQRVTSDIASSLGLKEQRGVIVSSVVPGSAAERAGVQRGDVIDSIDGQPVSESNALRNRIAGTEPGSEVTLAIVRGGKDQQIRAKLGEFQPPSDRSVGSLGPGGGPKGGGRLGVSVEPLTPEIAAQLGLAPGTTGAVVASVDSGSPAAEAGIRPGDILVEVNRKPVRSPSDVRDALNGSGSQPVLVLVNRGGQTVFVTVRPRR